MKRSLTQNIAVALVLLLVSRVVHGQEIPPANPDPKDIPALEQLKFTTLLVYRKTKDYSVSVKVNDAAYASFDSGSGWKIDPVPFKQGRNHVIVSFSPTPTKDPSSQSGDLTLVLADAPKPERKHSLILYAFAAADRAYCVTDLSFEFSDGRAGKLASIERHWADAQHKNLIFQMSSDHGSVWGPYDQHEQSWTADGRPVDEAVYKLSAKLGYLGLTQSKDYKPDGTLAAEVKDGDGVRRTFSSTGVLLLESHYHGNLLNGPYKISDDHGTLRISGQFRDDQQDGLWVRFDDHGKEMARCVYANGQPANGAQPIEPSLDTTPLPASR